MANYQVLFSGELVENAQLDAVQANVARELQLDERKARQLFSGRTVVLRSQLRQDEALAFQAKMAALGAICRVKDFTPKREPARYRAEEKGADKTLRDITAAHLECPRCGHLQLDSSHCARCGIDLEQALKQQRKEDLLIQKKIQELRAQRSAPQQTAPRRTISRREPETFGVAADAQARDGEPKLGKMFSWLKRSG
jgi:ribosomal protein L37E